MPFRLTGLSAEPFRPLFGLSDEALAARGVLRLAADDSAPCRVSLDDAAVGEPVLLVHYEHQPAPSLYRSSGPIFVRESAGEAAVTDAVPDSFRKRTYSARAYDREGLMVDAEVGEGTGLEALIEQMFARPDVAYLHLHHARRGCFACRVRPPLSPLRRGSARSPPPQGSGAFRKPFPTRFAASLLRRNEVKRAFSILRPNPG